MTRMEAREWGVATEDTGWRRIPDRLARYGWRVLLLSLAIGVIGGVIGAFVWQPSVETAPVVDECVNPPCFGGGGIAGLQDLPWAS